MANSMTAGQLPGYDQVKTIEIWLRNSIRYTPGCSEIPLSAVAVNL
jgi:transglutaminase-like putative cysteine protease